MMMMMMMKHILILNFQNPFTDTTDPVSSLGTFKTKFHVQGSYKHIYEA
jgi:hypothetical protein